ncbi:hypothetical protein TSOC_002093, partial [Tetrabaena socialis]
LHKRWVERKLEIEVGKVQAKLLSKGLSVPELDAVVLEASARLVHLPKLYIDLHGRNPNGTHKLPPNHNARAKPPSAPTVVQKLERMLNPSLLSPIPDSVAAAYGLPLSNAAAGQGEAGRAGEALGGTGGCASPPHTAVRSSTTLPLGQVAFPRHTLVGSQQLLPSQQQQQQQPDAGGAGHPGSPRHEGGAEALAADAAAGGQASHRPVRSPVLHPTWRPDLQGAEARIDDAMAVVQRVITQTSEMQPRERVLYLAKQANPDFELQHPRPARVEHNDVSHSRRDRRGSKQVGPDAGAGGRAPQLAPAPSRRRDGAGAPADGVLPALGRRSSSVGRLGAVPLPTAAAVVEAGEGAEALPPLTPSSKRQAGAAEAGEEVLPSASSVPSALPPLGGGHTDVVEAASQEVEEEAGTAAELM